jgi:Rrf2 family transcriptional regulator, cysteine metabolism repressor
MALSARVQYGTLALVELARVDDGRPRSASAIAACQGIPRPYLDQLMLILKRAGFIRSVRGPKGGHGLARPAQSLTLYDVYCALEGGAGELHPSQQDTQQGTGAAVLQSVFADAEQRFLDALSAVTIEDIAKRVQG